MAFKPVPVVPAGEAGALAVTADNKNQRLRRPEISDQTQIDPLTPLYCPDGAIALTAGQYAVSERLCKGCGICAQESPGIRMVPEYTGPRGILN
jgi:Pyruvate/2-oxoacid:ferredoxin oxidoreductase delta subunit